MQKQRAMEPFSGPSLIELNFGGLSRSDYGFFSIIYSVVPLNSVFSLSASHANTKK